VAADMTAQYTILLVDDESHVLHALQRTLRSEGYRLLAATDGYKALELLAAEHVDLIVSDIDMPEMDGVELIKQVRVSHPDVVRMLLTGDASLDSAMHAINDGEVHRYLTKPWDSAELRATLRDALARIGELRALALASQRISTRERMLEELEREHPGITRVDLPGGVYTLDLERLTTLAMNVRDDAIRSLFAGGAAMDDLADDMNEGDPWT
jgi:two-component system, probable response regulator PhcQ